MSSSVFCDAAHKLDAYSQTGNAGALLNIHKRGTGYKTVRKIGQGEGTLIYRCMNCGGNVVYDPSKKKMICLSCGGADCQEVVPSPQPMVCNNCGSQIPYTQFQSAGKCPSCGTYQLRDDKVSYPYGADVVLPFKISKHEAEEKLKAEFGTKLFIPSSFLSSKTLEKLKGVYVPFWMYDYDTNVDYQAIGTKVRTWTSGNKRYTETSYFDVARKLHVNYEGIPVDASIAMDDKIMDLMEPYDYAELIGHDNKYLSGFESEVYNMPPTELEGRARQKADKANRAWIHEYTSGYETLTGERFMSNNRQTAVRYGLMPVWVYEYRFQGQNYMFYVNGQTGKCVGTAPRSTSRAIGFTALLFAALFTCINGLAMILGVL